MSLAFALAAAAAGAALPLTSADPGDGFMLKLFDKGSSAVCLDGTQAGYYARPGNDTSTWILELEGGGWCISMDDCAGRAMGSLGSSSSWPSEGSPGMDGGSHGLFSSNCTINPHFCQAGKYHLSYCDGGSFASHRDEAVPVNSTYSVFFRGRDALDAFLDYLLTREGLAQAVNPVVILKGCSAGGLATVIHLDYVAQKLGAAVPGLRVVGLPDAGLFLDHDDAAGVDYYTPLYQWVAEAQNTTAPGSSDDSCLAAYPSPADQWRCFMAPYVVPHVSTPMFMSQDLIDSWQISQILRIPCSPTPKGPGNCNATEVQVLNDYRVATLGSLAPVLAAPQHGVFATTCVIHCHVNIDSYYTTIVVQNQTLRDTFVSWYNATITGQEPSLLTKVVDGELATNPTCP